MEIGSQAVVLKQELMVLGKSLQGMAQRPTMISGAVSVRTGEHFFEYSGWQATPRFLAPGEIAPQLELRMRSIYASGVNSYEIWPIGNCAEFKLLNSVLWDGIPEDGLLLATMRVNDLTLAPRCLNCGVTVRILRILGE